MSRSPASNPALLAAIAGVYFALGKLGLAVGGFNAMGTAVWPPSGFALAAVILLGPRIWPAMLGRRVPGLRHRHRSDGHVDDDRHRQHGRGDRGAVCSSNASRRARRSSCARTWRFASSRSPRWSPRPSAPRSSVQAMTFSPTPSSVWSPYATAWMTLWLANLTGILVVAPLTLLWTTTPVARIRWLELLEAVLVVVGLRRRRAWSCSAAGFPPTCRTTRSSSCACRSAVGGVPLRPARGGDRAGPALRHRRLGHAARLRTVRARRARVKASCSCRPTSASWP